MTLVGSMLVRDELHRYQPALAQHALTYLDHLVVLDDGSTDGTGDELRKLDKVTVHRHERSLWDERGEGAARGALLRHTLAAKPDYVLSIDADEIVPDGLRLWGLLKDEKGLRWEPGHYVPDPTAIALTIREVWERDGDPWKVRVDGGWAPHPVPILWQAPPHAFDDLALWQGGWSIPGTPLACGREPEVVRMVEARIVSVDILHLGWSNPDERQARYDRYMRIDGGEHHDLAHLQSILEEPELVDYAVKDQVRMWV